MNSAAVCNYNKLSERHRSLKTILLPATLQQMTSDIATSKSLNFTDVVESIVQNTLEMKTVSQREIAARNVGIAKT